MNPHVKNQHFITLQNAHMGQAELSLHGVGLALPDAETDSDGAPVPEWIHLLPAKELKTVDGRGPYKIDNMLALISASMGAGQKLVIDVNHATDRLAIKGEPAPAYGWIVALEARDNGLWGRVEWTDAGRELLAARAYRYISPAISRDTDFKVTAVLRASLVNNPNLLGLTELNSKGSPEMNFTEQLTKKLGLKSGADEGAILAAIDGVQKSVTDLQSALDPISLAVGLKAGASQTELMAAVQTLATRPKAAPATGIDQGQLITDLQSTVKDLTGQVADLTGDTKRKSAEAFIDAAILKGRVGVKSQREKFVEMHMSDPKATEAFVQGLPELLGSGSGSRLKPPAPRDGEIHVPSETAQVAALMGVDQAALKKTLKAEREAHEHI